MESLISVVTPAFNRAPYIKQTLESVLTQGYLNFEYIVVDDGSTDGTYEILQQYAAQGKIQLLTHPNRANRGQAAALNVGLKAVSGEFIAILDSDDVFAEDKLAIQMDYLKKHAQLGMVYGQGMAIDERGNELFPIPSDDHSETGDPNNLLLDCYMALPGGALARKSVYDKVGGFEESFRAGQDHDMVVRIAEAAPFAYLPGIAFYYRKHADSISQKGLERRWRIGFEILRRARERYPYRRSTIRKRSAILNFRMAQVMLQKKRHINAAAYLLKSGVLDPVRAWAVVRGREKIK